MADYRAPARDHPGFTGYPTKYHLATAEPLQRASGPGFRSAPASIRVNSPDLGRFGLRGGAASRPSQGVPVLARRARTRSSCTAAFMASLPPTPQATAAHRRSATRPEPLPNRRWRTAIRTPPLRTACGHYWRRRIPGTATTLWWSGEPNTEPPFAAVTAESVLLPRQVRPRPHVPALAGTSIGFRLWSESSRCRRRRSNGTRCATTRRS